ncbi:MAG: N-6 DNA methylase [Haemophilus parainfluenzae]|nr:N-6 DNA methylase [Haemophilus parainfluenzae]
MSFISDQISFGQFFTPKSLAKFMVGLLSVDKDAHILEPASGEGVFLDVLQEEGFNCLSAYEIDSSLISHYFVRNESFVGAKLPENSFDAIIGNPPYIRWKNLNSAAKDELTNHALWQKYFNSLCDYLYIFILKSVLLLKDGGELIFICPDYWFSTKHALGLRSFMLEHGGFEKIIRFHETPVFPKVNSSIMIFHYRKKFKPKEIQVWQCTSRLKLKDEDLVSLETLPNVKHFTIEQFNQPENWLFADKVALDDIYRIEKNCQLSSEHYCTIGDICNIGNGMVSGLDKAFQTILSSDNTQKELASSIKVAKAKHLIPYCITKTTDYIFIQECYSEMEFAKFFPNFYRDLQPYREQLNKRYCYGKTLAYWQWAFLRNYALFSRSEARILVPCKERITNKEYFRFALADENVYPTQDVTALFKKEGIKESLEYIVAYLNQSSVFRWLKYKGVVKGGIVEFSEKPLASIPFRRINWQDSKEIEVHRCITQSVKDYLTSAEGKYLDIIREQFKQLGVL